MATITHGDAQDMLAAFKRGWEERMPDEIVDLFAPDAEYHAEPSGPALLGANSIRELWNEICASQANVEFDAERIWVSGETVLVSWHAAYTRRVTGERVRLNGFMTLELTADGSVRRFRQWPVERVVGRDSTFRPEGGAA
jgi:ketosteroid isomerase-like protein